MIQIALLVFLPIISAPVVYILGRKRESLRDTVTAAVTGFCVVLSVSLIAGAIRGSASVFTLSGVFVNGLSFRADGFRSVYSLIPSVMWFGSTLFAREYFLHERQNLNSYWMFTLITFGATQGVMLSADLMTTFVFFEILSLASFPWVMHERSKEALYAGYTYLFVAIIGGLILLTGLILLYDVCGTLEYAALRESISAGADSLRLSGTDSVRLSAAAVCILLGFGAKAGMFPLHVWLPLAHPVAPSPASALLSGVLTKIGIFGILMSTLAFRADSHSFGMLILILGLVTMALGAVLALFSVNLKRTLACSSMSQIGFILTGIGAAVLCGAYMPDGDSGLSEETALALSGTVLHMVNHSMLKLLLFLAAGTAVMNLHRLNLNDLRGWGRNQPVLKLVFAIGALGISGVPLFNGYLSKSMLHEGLLAALETAEHTGISGGEITFLHAAEWIFLFSGGCTFAYMLKLFRCLFVERNADPDTQARYDAAPPCMNRLSSGVLISTAVILLVLGIPPFASRLTALMTGESVPFAAFSPENLRGAAISLGIGAAVYLVFVLPVLRPAGTYADRWPVALNLEGRVYRPLLLSVLPMIFGKLAELFAENRILKPLCRFLLLIASAFGRALSDSTDLLIMFLRRTVVREVRIQDGKIHLTLWHRLQSATDEAIRPMESFSFAMFMTCLGVILILGVLLILCL